MKKAELALIWFIRSIIAIVTANTVWLGIVSIDNADRTGIVFASVIVFVLVCGFVATFYTFDRMEDSDTSEKEKQIAEPGFF